MSSSIMNSYRIDERDFPLRLYRVDYPGSQTTYSQHGGFQAASNFTPRRLTGLRNAVEFHLDWQSRTTSPFISAFSNRQHAQNWAQTWYRNHNYGTCYIVEMVIEEEDNLIVFSVDDLLGRLNIATSLQPSQYRSEYLCFHHVPSDMIVGRQPVHRELTARTGYARVVRVDSDSDEY